ncbi:F-box protein SKIP27-like [Alnus glutinosa]|uniref:F-box protein SKIP27-like n=1 Tax=Alnus glutinosa TaxID=3517 RepID=UPI002D7799C0|nr:F-box protein SKIP27-like [Alnus glutinosa]
MDMALGRRCGSSLRLKRGRVVGEEGLGLGFVRYTRGLGRKRVLISNDMEASPMDSALKTPTKKRCGESVVLEAERSLLEALPQDILIRVLCGVNHEDLNQLFHVSKAIREASLIAKESHFAYCTPKKTRVFRNAIDLEDSSDFEDVKPPNAPKQQRKLLEPFLSKEFSDITAELFASPDEDQWPRKVLFMST